MNEHETTHENLNEEAMSEEPMSTMEEFFYHQRRALEETAKALDALLPEGFKEHGTEAGREFAKGFRVLVDAAIDELKKVSEKEEIVEKAEGNNQSDDDKPSTTGKTKVKVEVE